MHGRFELFEHIGAHFVARDAERLAVHQLQYGVEGAPENNSGDKAGEHENAEAEYRAWPPQHVPYAARKREHTPRKRRRRSFGRGHRRPPGAARLSKVSMSTKSFSTGAFTVCWGTWHWVQKYRRGEIDAKVCPSRSKKCVMLIIGACVSCTRVRAWQDRHLLARRLIS